MALQRVGSHRAGLAALAGNAGQLLAATFVQRVGRKGRLAQQFADQRDHRRQVLAHGGDGHRQALPARADAHLGAQLVEGIADLLAAQTGAALVDQRAHRRDRHRLATQARLVAEAQCQPRLHRAAAGALGQQRQLQPAGQRGQLGARVQVGGAGVEGFGLGHRGITLVAGHQRRQVDTRRRRCAAGLVGGQVGAHGAVVGQQQRGGHPLHIGQLQRADAVALDEVQPPITVADGLGQGHAHLLGVAETLVPVVQGLGAHPLQLFGGDRLGGDGVDRGQQCVAGLGHILARRQLGAQHQRAGLGQAVAEAEGRCRQLLVDQPLVQPPRRRRAQDLDQHLHRRVVGVGGRHAVPAHQQQRRAALAPHGDAALAVLRRIQRVGALQQPGRFGQRPEILRRPGQHLGRVELAGHHQGGVVGLVVQAVEGLQAADVDVLDVGPRADGALAVVVPLVHRRQGLLRGAAERVVLARLHLVAHHRHLGVQVGAGDEAVEHRVGLPAEVPAQGVGVGREAGVVVGAVVPGGAVEAQAALAGLGHHVAGGRRALEDQVLQQVGHAGLAVTLVPRADAVGDVDGGGGLGVVGHQQQLQAVGQAVFGDAFDLGDLLQCPRRPDRLRGNGLGRGRSRHRSLGPRGNAGKGQRCSQQQGRE